MKIIITLLVLGGLVACSNSLYQASIQDAQDATRANLRAYQLSIVDDAGTGAGARAFNKVAYCLTTAILSNEKQPLPEGGLTCPTK
jgi:hypothetical protein